MKCNTCGGKGTLVRPYGRLVQEIVRQSQMIDGEQIEKKETVVTETGGLDACPVCAANAEAEYQSLKGHPRGQLRSVS